MERSFRVLDDAIGSPTQTFTQRTGFNISHMPKGMPNLDNTVFLPSGARDRSFLPPAEVTRTGNRVFDETVMKFDNNQSILSATLYSADLEENPGVQGTENLFNEFLSVMNTGSLGLETVPEFEDMVTNHIRRLRQLILSQPTFSDKNPKTAAVCEDLINERNTWRILSKLYTDRLITSTEQSDPDTSLVPINPNSEKRIIERFFLTNKEVRQAYIVVDWLENNSKDANERMITQQMEWFTDATICWENTTAFLCRGQTRPGMVKHLDPDAPNRNGLVLHELDVEDDTKLLSCMMNLVRCGLLDEAQDLCNRLGQSWRAATLEGWKLYHDPNYESGTDGQGDKIPIEGNKHRDIWKKVAWRLTKDKNMPQMERTIYAALCGNLEQLRSVCTVWEDKLWAGAKCAVDVMVETEIRSQIIKNFAELPTEYWNSSTSLSKVIAEASSGLTETSNINKYRKIQSHIILDDYPGLVASMVSWIKENGSGLEAHMLRLMSHLVLVHRSLGIHGDPVSEETILTEYTRYLMSRDMLTLIPWYVSKLEESTQLPLHSAYLSNVQDPEEQALCLQLGLECGLDIQAMIVSAVSIVRSGEESVDNEAMVASLGWLTHHSSQVRDLLYQTNAVMRRLLGLGQVELAGEALQKVPRDTQNLVLAAWRQEGGGQTVEAGLVREYLALKVYLEAQETFSDWFDHFHRGQPRRPVMPENPTFTEKVAHEQKEKQYLAELDRWRGGQLIQSRQAEEKLKEVLNFPGGWLIDQDPSSSEEMMDVEESKRLDEMSSLRGELIPQTFLLLHSVLHNTGQFQAAIRLANLLADESTANYSAFTKDKIKQFLGKVRESSLAVLDEGKDPWGFPKP